MAGVTTRGTFRSRGDDSFDIRGWRNKFIIECEYFCCACITPGITHTIYLCHLMWVCVCVCVCVCVWLCMCLCVCMYVCEYATLYLFLSTVSGYYFLGNLKQRCLKHSLLHRYQMVHSWYLLHISSLWKQTRFKACSNEKIISKYSWQSLRKRWGTRWPEWPLMSASPNAHSTAIVISISLELCAVYTYLWHTHYQSEGTHSAE